LDILDDPHYEFGSLIMKELPFKEKQNAVEANGSFFAEPLADTSKIIIFEQTKAHKTPKVWQNKSHHLKYIGFGHSKAVVKEAGYSRHQNKRDIAEVIDLGLREYERKQYSSKVEHKIVVVPNGELDHSIPSELRQSFGIGTKTIQFNTERFYSDGGNAVGFLFDPDFNLEDFQLEEHDSTELLQDFSASKYSQFHQRALADRLEFGSHSEMMSKLYYFWANYLKDHFNFKMYREFRDLANEDADAEQRFGITALFGLYLHGLRNKFRPKIFHDFQTNALRDNRRGYFDGFETFALFVREKPNDLHLTIHHDISKYISHHKRKDSTLDIQNDQEFPPLVAA